MNSTTKFIIAAFAATAIAPATAFAQDAKNQGYLTDSSGNAVVIGLGSGLCVRDSDWTPARSIEPCDPVNRPVAAAPAPTPRPAVVATAPAPAPAPIVATPPAAKPQPAPARSLPQKMSFSADALFAFDKSELKPEGKAMLDDLVRQLEGGTYDVIVATGHTDRIGSSTYNQKLSERRANTVKQYLISRNIPAARIDAEGKGETQPMTNAGDCPGAKSAKVIACLQPDRRVDVEMTGSKPVLGFR